MQSGSTTASAPGKVLITGGYLVLERPFAGLVLSLSSRFEATVSFEEPQLVKASTSSLCCHVTVLSPQFDTTVSFLVDLDALTVTLLDGKPNPYVSNALLWSLVFADRATRRSESFVQRVRAGLRVTIQGANDFYSQLDELARLGLPPTSASLASLPPFRKVGASLSSMKKTGLGSSAALVTCLVAAVSCHVGGTDNTSILQGLHNIAQLAHCAAQGKIGSGFDVSSACFGSQVYVRFSPSFLEPYLKAAPAQVVDQIEHLAQPWDNEHHALTLPRGMRLVLGDVSVGSNTPAMVSLVLKWRAAQPEQSQKLWNDLNAQNERVRSGLAKLGSIANVEDALAKCASLQADKWTEAAPHDVGVLLADVRDAFRLVRKYLCEMGEHAGTPIEPEEQTALCDATMNVPGVLAAGVPGAGGFDAVFALVLNESVISRVEEFWTQKWTTAKVVPMIVREDASGVRVNGKELLRRAT